MLKNLERILIKFKRFGFYPGEFNYFRNPEAVNKLLRTKYFDKKIFIYGDGKHTKEVLDYGNLNILGIIRFAENDPNFISYNFDSYSLYEIDEIKKVDYDYIILLGYWTQYAIRNFSKKYQIPLKKILPIYKTPELIYISNKKIPKPVKFKNNKPTLTLVLSNDIRDFYSISSHTLSKYFNLIKIYYVGNHIYFDNRNFKKVYNLKGNFYLLIKLLELIQPGIIVFAHTGPYENIKFNIILKNFINKSKIIYSTTDFFFNSSFDMSLNQLARFLNQRFKIVKLLQESEFLNMKLADAIITNWGGEYFSFLKTINKNSFFSKYFHTKQEFVFKYTSINQSKIKFCFAGNLAFYRKKLIHKIMTLDSIFEVILKQGHSVYVYHAQDSPPREPYIKLIRQYKNFYWKNFTPMSKMPEELSQYNYGLNILNIDERHFKIYKTLFNSLFQAKMVTYLAAGIPIIISDEFKILKEFVLDNKIGVSIKRDKIRNFNFSLLIYKYEEFMENVKIVQKKYLNEHEDEKLAQFLLSCIEK